MLIKSQRSYEEKGFTLLEVLFAVVIFSIGMMAVVGMHGLAVTSNGSAKMHTEAATLASDRIEKLKMEDYDNVIDGTAKILNNGNTYTISWEVKEEDFDFPTDGEMDAKRVMLNVEWKDRGRQKTFIPSFVFIKIKGVKL